MGEGATWRKGIQGLAELTPPAVSSKIRSVFNFIVIIQTDILYDGNSVRVTYSYVRSILTKNISHGFYLHL